MKITGLIAASLLIPKVSTFHVDDSVKKIKHLLDDGCAFEDRKFDSTHLVKIIEIDNCLESTEKIDQELKKLINNLKNKRIEINANRSET